MGNAGGAEGADGSVDAGDAGDVAQADRLAGELRCDGHRVPLRGRTLRLILWLAGHQTRINEIAPESGQLWLTWKGNGPRSIDGDIRTRM